MCGPGASPLSIGAAQRGKKKKGKVKKFFGPHTAPLLRRTTLYWRSTEGFFSALPCWSVGTYSTRYVPLFSILFLFRFSFRAYRSKNDTGKEMTALITTSREDNEKKDRQLNLEPQILLLLFATLTRRKKTVIMYDSAIPT